jgi:uncharacterized protein (DUF1697 family)
MRRVFWQEPNAANRPSCYCLPKYTFGLDWTIGRVFGGDAMMPQALCRRFKAGLRSAGKGCAITMTRYVALLRAINVGGTGKLPMADLKTICVGAGFTDVQTYIASGNVVFASTLPPAKVKAALEARLKAYAGRPMGVVVRTASEMASVLKANPFSKLSPTFTVAIFLDGKPPADALDRAVGMADEKMRLGRREIFVHYPSGQGRSKLKIPAAKTGTARNMNTIAKLAAMASKR